MHKKFGSHNGSRTQSIHHSENTKFKLITMMKQRRVVFSEGVMDAYCVCTHVLLVGTHGNSKPNVYRVHIKI